MGQAIRGRLSRAGPAQGEGATSGLSCPFAPFRGLSRASKCLGNVPCRTNVPGAGGRVKALLSRFTLSLGAGDGGFARADRAACWQVLTIAFATHLGQFGIGQFASVKQLLPLLRQLARP